MTALVDFREHATATTVVLKRPTSRYINEFIKLKCAPDLLALKLFPNAKEITESMAAFQAVRKFISLRFPLDNPTVSMIAVGDGAAPRTAALFAHRTAWTCYSVDPRLRVEKSSWQRVKRLRLIPKKIEDVTIECAYVVKVAVHSHASLDAAMKSVIALSTATVAIPCCVPQEINNSYGCIVPPTCTYEDWGIWSPERTVKVWY